ncbi:MAG TPA: histidine phosphatase family protein [Anaerolineales bacterium]
MPSLLLIRHGENDYTRTGKLAGRMPGIGLNERGRKQAEELARALAHAPVAAIYSSPLERAMQTAGPIGQALGLRVVATPGLLEADVGEWQGKSVRRLAMTKYWRVVQNAPSRARHPGGESFAETQVRVVSALDAICAKHKDRALIACVFHSDPIKLAVAHYVGLPLDHFQRLGCDTGSVTLLTLSASSAHLIWLNRRPPLEFPHPQQKK